MKKCMLLLLFSLVLGGGVFAQTNTVSAGVSAGAGLPVIASAGFQATYEFSIFPQLSVGANVFWEVFPLALFAVAFTQDPNHLVVYGVEGQVHWYPFSKIFHVDAGLGWGYYMGMHTLVIAPGIGWKIDVGKPGGFIINPCLRLEIFKPLEENIFRNSDKNAELVPVNLTIYLNIGYSF